MWYDFFDQIYVINLDKRLDRWVDVCGEMEKFNIPFKRKAAVECPNGAEGLMRTMIEIFNEAIDKQWDNVFIIEDDLQWVDGVDVNEVMEDVVKQLPKDYHLCFGGCQPTKGFSHWYSHNLLPVTGAFSTHCVMYSRKAIELILASSFSYPIDNFYCDRIEPYGHCYAIHPFLATQRFGFSNIGNSEIDWDVFLSQRHNQKIIELQEKGAHRPNK